MTGREEQLKEVSAVYAELAARPIERNCTATAQCCSFRATGRTPFLTKGEAFFAIRAWRAAGRKVVSAPPDGSCPFLASTGRCQIYEARPFGCRTHFCEAAGGPFARAEVRDLIQRLERVDTELGGRGGVNLFTAVTAAMEEWETDPGRGNRRQKGRCRGRAK
ncbi:MAG: Fe-S-cluster containining protein [Verrucomicrobia bacterium]|nr:MAG: Fe-S-cluster containining protein [Verrucomicrobiota bacterium]